MLMQFVALDGLFRANAKLRGPGVVLAFESKHGSLSYPCDTYNDWQDNVRAIAPALEALRAVDRYGVTRQAEQYRGWAKLPAPPSADAAKAVEALRKALGIVLCVPDTADQKATFRKLVRPVCHPDRNGGDDTRWKLWTAAASALSIEV